MISTIIIKGLGKLVSFIDLIRVVLVLKVKNINFSTMKICDLLIQTIL